MLFGAIALIAIGAILPTLPPSVFNQSEIQGNLTAGQVTPIPPPPPGAPIVERSRMGLDRYCDLVNYQHRIECNLNCCRQFSLDR
jgi:hypothetical protein